MTRGRGTHCKQGKHRPDPLYYHDFLSGKEAFQGPRLGALTKLYHLLFQCDDIFVARVLPGQPESQVVGFGAEVQRGKGYSELLSHHKTHM